MCDEMQFAENEMTARPYAVTVSVVSHGHGKMVADLLADLESIDSIKKIILTYNITEPNLVSPSMRQKLIIVNNEIPRGFGENHNTAFNYCDTQLFCVLNPDIQLSEDLFSPLISRMMSSEISMIAPLVLSPHGTIEDSFRSFPGIFPIFKKIFGLSSFLPTQISTNKLIYPEWLAGMFMLFDSGCYKKVGGFDEKFFLYCEDVDICMRLKNYCGMIALHPSVSIIHDARRESHKNMRFTAWHIKSLLRLWLKYPKKALGI